MKKKMIAFFTATYPYPKGEQFIESEIEYLAKAEWADVVVAPYLAVGNAREMPSSIKLFRPSVEITTLSKMSFIFRALFSRFFWGELACLIELRKLTSRRLVAALRVITHMYVAKKNAEKFIESQGEIDVAYCYWNNAQAYAACLLKREGRIGAVISRAHGGDVYEQASSTGYLPLKRQFAKDFDKVFAISKQGRDYLEGSFGFDGFQLEVSRLGVGFPDSLSVKAEVAKIRVLSLSFVLPIKRVDKIIGGIFEFAKKRCELEVEWVHIGDGPIKKQVEDLAEVTFSKLNNVDYDFLGMMDNDDVLKYLGRNKIDVLINASESEGIPVSIMEAMAHGVPVVAPSVGGIPEIVDAECGVLLNADPSVFEIADGIEQVVCGDTDRYKNNARRKIKNNYDKEKNYTEFVGRIHTLSEALK